MKKLLKIVAIFLLASFAFTACGSAPIYNTKTKIDSPKSSATTYRAIRSAGKSLGWKINRIRPGVAQGKLYLRKHIAVIRINYSKYSYSIKYVKSTNLKYNAAKQTIHTNYNGWIQNLDNAINARL